MSLSKMRQEYREGLRGLPTYEELAALSAPEQCADPIVERNVSMLRQRSTVGVQKYGTTLADNKLPLRAWLNHALEESLDQANYLQAAMAKIDSAASKVADATESAELFGIGYLVDGVNVHPSRVTVLRPSIAAAPVQAQEPVKLRVWDAQAAYAAYGQTQEKPWKCATWRDLGDHFQMELQKMAAFINAHNTSPISNEELNWECKVPYEYNPAHFDDSPALHANAEQHAQISGAMMKTRSLEKIRELAAHGVAIAAPGHMLGALKQIHIIVNTPGNFSAPVQPVAAPVAQPEVRKPIMWAALNMNGKAVCVNQDKQACDIERLCIKTPTTIVPLYAGAPEPQ